MSEQTARELIIEAADLTRDVLDKMPDAQMRLNGSLIFELVVKTLKEEREERKTERLTNGDVFEQRP